ncbi:uncharacterized protein LTR77_005948 [Saxophila tyrrhenica]|uniref:DUF1917-domain-containing protein n=1 Tax=Saxophila tyrrhenica TaxID=1690608 RepID=A0AAV9PA09_9PEZI|nr:hypothetical protein LTR77_005948 [Saxophila tyrrhenica]
MAVDLVDGAGWISDESDFYGHEALRKKLRKKAERKLATSVIPSLTPVRKVETPPKVQKPAVSEPPAAEKIKHDSHHDEIPFQAQDLRPAETSRDVAMEGDDMQVEAEVSSDRFYGEPSAWQQRETITEFMRRAPVTDPETAMLGPWLWVRNPIMKPKWQKQADVDAFVETGIPLLQGLLKQRTKMETTYSSVGPATITRKMGPYRDQLENNLLALAVKTGTTCGKWMLFPSNEEYPRFWRVIAEATAESRLGPTSKAATHTPVDPLNLICVYTYDFTDADDVKRVLEELIELGVCFRDGKPIYYKCDAYTYLDIKSNNEYKLRASMYNSKDLLQNTAKPKKEGPIDRSQKQITTADIPWMF